MYDAGPRFPSLPSVLNQEDPDAHRELQALADLRGEDAEHRAYEGAWEFMPIARARDGWELMEWDTVEEERGWL